MGFKKGDTVKVISEGNSSQSKRGVVHKVEGDLIHVKLQGNNYVNSFWDTALEKVEPPRVGDLVRVLSYGKYQAQEGHVTNIFFTSERPYSVDLGDDVPDFDAVDLEVIERIPPEKIVREEGKEINPKHLQKGDRISVVVKRQPKDGVSETLTAEGVYDYSNNYGTLFTKNYGVLMNSHDAEKSVSTVITLLKKSDPVLDKLESLPVGSLVSWTGGPTRWVAGKKEGGQWSTMGFHPTGSHHSTYMTDQIRRYISDTGDTYEILKEGDK